MASYYFWMFYGCRFSHFNAAFGEDNSDHGRLRPLPRTAKMDHGHSHGGSWDGTPTYEEQKGNYPFVAKNLDVVKGWLDWSDASFLLLSIRDDLDIDSGN